jgi:hypothetical protein
MTPKILETMGASSPTMQRSVKKYRHIDCTEMETSKLRSFISV